MKNPPWIFAKIYQGGRSHFTSETGVSSIPSSDKTQFTKNFVCVIDLPTRCHVFDSAIRVRNLRLTRNSVARNYDPTGLSDVAIYDGNDLGDSVERPNKISHLANGTSFGNAAGGFPHQVEYPGSTGPAHVQLVNHVKQHGPINLLILIDHGVQTGNGIIQELGEEPIGVGGVSELVDGVISPGGGLVFAGCEVGGNLPYCWAVAERIDRPVFASPVDVAYTGNLNVGFQITVPLVSVKPSEGPWYVYNPIHLPGHQVSTGINQALNPLPTISLHPPLLPTPLNGKNP